MTTTRERQVLNADELSVVEKTHYPDISGLNRDDLEQTAERLREMRAEVRDICNMRRRRIRRSREARHDPPQEAERGAALKQRIYVGALKRVNREIGRFAQARKHESQKEIAERALQQKRDARLRNHPSAGRSAKDSLNSAKKSPRNDKDTFNLKQPPERPSHPQDRYHT